MATPPARAALTRRHTSHHFMQTKLAVALCGALLLPACAPEPQRTATTTTEAAATTTAATATVAAPPAAAEPTFAVDVTLSPAAATKLAAINETIVVGADYYGNRAESAPVEGEPGAGVELGRQTVEMLQPGRAVFALANADPAKMHLVADRDVRILINVYSGRRNAEDNLLDCGMFEDSSRVAVRAPVRIHCTLIGE